MKNAFVCHFQILETRQWCYIGKCLIFIFELIFWFSRKGSVLRRLTKSWVVASALPAPWSRGAPRIQPSSHSSECAAGKEHLLLPKGSKNTYTSLCGAIYKLSNHGYFSFVVCCSLFVCLCACSVLLSRTLKVIFFPGSKLSLVTLHFPRNNFS